MVDNSTLRLLAWMLLAFALCAAQDVHAGTSYRFGGADIKFCKLKDKTYTCNKLPLTEWDDKMVIDSGYTVDIDSDVAFGWDHGLAMSGTARLISSGNLNVGDIKPSGIAITGGSLHAGGKFTIGNVDQAITANVTAGSMQLGSGSKLTITGSVVATGQVSISSNAVIHGPVTGGDITTESGVILNGDLTAKTGRVIVGDKNRVSGNITARVAELLASSVVVKGDIKASQSLTLASGNTVEGYVDTGILTLDSAEAIVKGSALVDRANLYHHGRVTGFIECRAGATVNDCSCVNNQSQYPFNSELGPKCGPSKPQETPALDHFLIEHDGSAGTCSTKQVKVTACANAACTSTYGGGASIVMQPGGASATIGTSGITSAAEVSSIAAGALTLSLTQGGSRPAVKCRNTKTGSSSCDMTFTGGVNFNVAVPDHRAGQTVEALISAVKANDTNTACVPGFVGDRKIDLSCNHALPATGKQALTLGSADAQQTLTCSGNAAQTRSLDVSFDTQGKAKFGLSYPDAGRMELAASSEQVKGKGSFAVAPDRFELTAPAPLRAGLDFNLGVRALNKSGAVTPNFDSTLLASEAPFVEIGLACVGGKLSGALNDPTVTFKSGVAQAATSFSEVGKVDLNATMEDFLGVKAINIAGSTNGGAANCPANVGPFVPMYYQVELKDAATRVITRNGKEFSYYYSDEPFPLKISAMNAKGAVTVNYPAGYGATDTLAFSVWDKDGVALPASLGALTATLKGSDFTAGVAAPQARYRYAVAQTEAVMLRLRVETQNKAAGYHTTSADAEAYEKARPDIRSGRLRIGSRFGPAGTDLDLPVTAEYWTGKSWTRNFDDDFTIVPASALALKPAQAAPKLPQLVDGLAWLRLRRAGAGSVDAAVNLGATNADQSCLAEKPVSTGAAMPWLQSRSGCIDPSGRAIFGIQSPETRRSIHVREVYR